MTAAAWSHCQIVQNMHVNLDARTIASCISSNVRAQSATCMSKHCCAVLEIAQREGSSLRATLQTAVTGDAANALRAQASSAQASASALQQKVAELEAKLASEGSPDAVSMARLQKERKQLLAQLSIARDVESGLRGHIQRLEHHIACGVPEAASNEATESTTTSSSSGGKGGVSLVIAQREKERKRLVGLVDRLQADLDLRQQTAQRVEVRIQMLLQGQCVWRLQCRHCSLCNNIAWHAHWSIFLHGCCWTQCSNAFMLLWYAG